MTGGGAALPHGGAAPLFPDDLPPGADRARGVWDLDHLLPVPARRLSCPVCAGALAVKDWKFHNRKRVGSASPWRCDVRLKCMTCGYVPTFGVLVTQEMYQRATQTFTVGQWIHWRAGRSAMEEAPDGSA